MSYAVGDAVVTPWGEGVVIDIDPSYLGDGTPGYRVLGDEITGNGGHAEGTWWSEPRVEPATLQHGNPVQSPPHYDLPGGIQVIDLIRGESFLRGNALKYIFRAPRKGKELEDMRKAAEYVKWEIQRLENE